jgi:hypothetical protein
LAIAFKAPALYFAGGNAMKSELKICSKCNAAKPAEGNFYVCRGQMRSECKACTISRNVIHQQRTKAWMHRFVDDEEKRSYMVDYYSKNKEKFAEYRRKFKERYPGYHKEYNRKRKNAPK